MAQKPCTKEQRRLMSDGSHSGEETDDTAHICRSYDQDIGLCKRLFHSKTAKLSAMLCMIVGYFFTELVVGHITNSLTLVADSFHMLSDALSLIVALVAVRMSRRTARDPFRPWPSKEPYFNTFGWVRFEVLGALINSTFLLALCISITLEAVEKFTKPEFVDQPKLVLAVGGGGLAVNIFGLIIFGAHSHGHGHSHHHTHGHSHKSDGDGDSRSENAQSPQKKKNQKVADEQQLNMKAVFLHVLGDALGSVIVMVSATVLWLVPRDKHPWTIYMDPAMSLILVCIMIFTTVPLFKQSSMILLQTVPKHIKLEVIRGKLKKIAGIQALHDLHIWQLAGDKIVASVHVQCSNAETYLKLLPKMKESLHDEGIHSFTIQPEFSFSDNEQSPFCQMVCGESCVEKTCCPQDNPKSNKCSGDPESCPKVSERAPVTEAATTSSPSATAVIMEEENSPARTGELPVNFMASSPQKQNSPLVTLKLGENLENPPAEEQTSSDDSLLNPDVTPNPPDEPKA